MKVLFIGNSFTYYGKCTATKNEINPDDDAISYGMLYAAEVFSFEELHSEIESILITDKLVENWTYPLIQPKLIEEARKRGFII